MESNQDRLKAAVILKEKLDYNEQMIYHLVLAATVSSEKGYLIWSSLFAFICYLVLVRVRVR